MKNIIIIREEFKAYLEVQQSGVTNMFDISIVSELTGLSKDKVLYIIKNYGRLKKKFIIE